MKAGNRLVFIFRCGELDDRFDIPEDTDVFQSSLESRRCRKLLAQSSSSFVLKPMEPLII
jgi:hypothetical protein